MRNAIAFFCLLSIVSTAQAATSLLYVAINAPEVDARSVNSQGIPSMGANIVSKSVGGLTCTKTTVVYPRAQPQYSCTISSESYDAETIYNALNLSEKDGRPVNENGIPSLGANILVKAADGLACKKITVVYPGAQPKYSCVIGF